MNLTQEAMIQALSVAGIYERGMNQHEIEEAMTALNNSMQTADDELSSFRKLNLDILQKSVSSDDDVNSEPKQYLNVSAKTENKRQSVRNRPLTFDLVEDSGICPPVMNTRKTSQPKQKKTSNINPQKTTTCVTEPQSDSKQCNEEGDGRLNNRTKKRKYNRRNNVTANISKPNIINDAALCEGEPSTSTNIHACISSSPAALVDSSDAPVDSSGAPVASSDAPVDSSDAPITKVMVQFNDPEPAQAEGIQCTSDLKQADPKETTLNSNSTGEETTLNSNSTDDDSAHDIQIYQNDDSRDYLWAKALLKSYPEGTILIHYRKMDKLCWCIKRSKPGIPNLILSKYPSEAEVNKILKNYKLISSQQYRFAMNSLNEFKQNSDSSSEKVNYEQTVQPTIKHSKANNVNIGDSERNLYNEAKIKSDKLWENFKSSSLEYIKNNESDSSDDTLNKKDIRIYKKGCSLDVPWAEDLLSKYSENSILVQYPNKELSIYEPKPLKDVRHIFSNINRYVDSIELKKLVTNYKLMVCPKYNADKIGLTSNQLSAESTSLHTIKDRTVTRSPLSFYGKKKKSNEINIDDITIMPTASSDNDYGNQDDKRLHNILGKGDSSNATLSLTSISDGKDKSYPLQPFVKGPTQPAYLNRNSTNTSTSTGTSSIPSLSGYTINRKVRDTSPDLILPPFVVKVFVHHPVDYDEEMEPRKLYSGMKTRNLKRSANDGLNATIQFDTIQTMGEYSSDQEIRTSKRLKLRERCPICLRDFPKDQIEGHAATCCLDDC